MRNTCCCHDNINKVCVFAYYTISDGCRANYAKSFIRSTQSRNLVKMHGEWSIVEPRLYTSMNVLNTVFERAGMTPHKICRTGETTKPTKVQDWDTSSDKLTSTVPDASTTTTRHELISVISKDCNPLGVSSPWVLHGNIPAQPAWIKVRGMGRPHVP